jgi:hypothetical protein
MGLYAAGGVSAGGITYLATRLLRRRPDQHAGEIETPEERRVER